MHQFWCIFRHLSKIYPMHSIVSPQWLHDHLHDESLVVLYTTLLAKKAVAPKEIESQQIVGARFFDLQKVFSRQDSGLPNTYPTEQQFEEGCRALGINTDSKIVVYDSLGIYSSPRVWFLFKSMGHQEIYVLDGGLQEWIHQGFQTVEKKHRTVEHGNFKAQFNPNFLISIEGVAENLKSQVAQVIDARSELRFRGEAPEPRSGLRSGHIPQSSSLHYAHLLKDGKYKSKVEIKRLLSEVVEGNKPLIFSCGSGITACILYLAADEFLENELKVYDGSWTEWGSTHAN